MNNGFLFLLTTVLFMYLFIYFFLNKLPEVPEYAKMQFHMATLLEVLVNLSQGKISDILNQREREGCLAFSVDRQIIEKTL